jgi:hypothetical protein
MPDAPAPAQPRPFRRNFRNWLSWSGMVLAASALFAFCLLFAIDLIASHRNPYIGILAYLIAPLFFLLGIFLTFLGANYSLAHTAPSCGSGRTSCDQNRFVAAA